MSGHLVFPQKQSEDHKETLNYFSGPLYQRPLHSGPLVPGYGCEMVGREAGERRPHVSNKVNLPKLSGLVASRTSSLSGDQKENPVPSRPRETIEVQISLESTNGSESRRRHDTKHHSQRIDPRKIENGKVSTETLIQVSFVYYYSFLPISLSFCFHNCQHLSVNGFASHQQFFVSLVCHIFVICIHLLFILGFCWSLFQDGHGSMGNNIYHLSGPLLVSSNNIDQMLKERDRKIQEYSRRARMYKSGEIAHAKQN